MYTYIYIITVVGTCVYQVYIYMYTIYTHVCIYIRVCVYIYTHTFGNPERFSVHQSIGSLPSRLDNVESRPSAAQNRLMGKLPPNFYVVARSLACIRV